MADFEYSTSFHPPAPVIQALFARPLTTYTTEGVRVATLVDTGADITVIPQRVIDWLKLYPVDEVLVAGYTGETSREWVYSVVLVVTEFEPQLIRVAGSRKTDIALLGRDIINQWTLLLYGKQQVFKLSA